MRKLRILFLITAIFTASSTLIAQSTTDIAQIINKFVSSNSTGGVGWSFFKDNYRVKRYDDSLVLDGDRFKVRFSSLLTMDGKPIFNTELGDAGNWGLTLYGARVGAHTLYIETFLIYKDPNDVIDYLTRKLSMRKFRTTEDDGYSSFSAIYTAKGSYIEISYSMGASGCGDISIYVTKDLKDLNKL